MSDSKNKEPALCPKAKKRGMRSAASLAKSKMNFRDAQEGFLIKQQRAVFIELDVVKEELGRNWSCHLVQRERYTKSC